MTVLRNESLAIALENNVKIVIHSQLEKIRSELERQFHSTCLSDDSIHDLREIQCIICDADQINEDRTLLLSDKIDFVKKKVDLALEQIKIFHQKHNEPLPDKVFDDLTEILAACRLKIEFAKQKLGQIQAVLGRVLQQKTNISQIRTKSEFKFWAEAVEELTPLLEAYSNEFSDMPIGVIEDLGTELLVATAKESDETTQKERYRRRIKYAGAFLIDLARRKRHQLLKERSVEARAIERIKNIEETELISVSEPGRPINIDKINERLKQRGYRVQIPCEDLAPSQS